MTNRVQTGLVMRSQRYSMYNLFLQLNLFSTMVLWPNASRQMNASTNARRPLRTRASRGTQAPRLWEPIQFIALRRPTLRTL